MRASAIAALLAIATGCEPPPPPRFPLGVPESELARPGVTCPHGMHFEPDHGCTGETEGGSATLRVVQQNDMGSGFVLTGALYTLDGRLLYNWKSDGDEAKKRAVVFEARVGAGEHVIDAVLLYRGHGVGVFSYLKGYKFKVRSSHAFRAEASQLTDVLVTGHEKGGPTTPLEERPAVRWKAVVLPPGDTSAPGLRVPSGSP
jgi:hypothetical protein